MNDSSPVDGENEFSGLSEKLSGEIHKVIVGMNPIVEKLLIALVAQGHVLIEGMPGVAKTLLASTLASTLDLVFHRIQFTPDLLPADLIGTVIYHQQTGEFRSKKGPLFANLILADEINRAPAKVQSALLEAMQERQVTFGEETHPLPSPFLVVATQNPLDHEGTYPLPEAQLDRFMMKIQVGYPTLEDELEILGRHGRIEVGAKAEKVASSSMIEKSSREVDKVHLEESLKTYMARLARATRSPKEHGVKNPGFIKHGVSPRGTVHLLKASKALALLRGRTFVLPQDIKEMAPVVFRHRIGLSYEALAEGQTPDDILRSILETVPVDQA